MVESWLDEGKMRELGMFKALGLALGAGEITSRTLVERSLERIAASTDLNAVVLVDGDRALAQADMADRTRRNVSQPPPLAGLPVLIKDIDDVEGLPTTFGSLIHESAQRATEDSLTPRRMKAAGGIIVGKTNLPEYAMEGYTSNLLFGATHNPWRRGWSPGGSSGGSAAALSAGLAPVATGTDGGGSTRIPAAMCGLVGIKPTSGLVAHRPVRMPVDISSGAPMANMVEDLKVLLRIESGPEVGDPTCLVAVPEPAREMNWPRTLLATDGFGGGEGLSDSLQEAFDQAVEGFREVLGCDVSHLPHGGLFRTGDIDDDWAIIYSAEDVHTVGRDLLRANLSRLDPGIARWVETGLTVTLEQFLDARSRRFKYVRELDELLGSEAVVLCPILRIEGYGVDGTVLGLPGPGIPMECFNTAATNLTGHPSVTVPAGLVNGMPFGLQLVGPRGSDWLLLDVARQWERANPWPLAAPGYRPFFDPGAL